MGYESSDTNIINSLMSTLSMIYDGPLKLKIDCGIKLTKIDKKIYESLKTATLIFALLSI